MPQEAIFTSRSVKRFENGWEFDIIEKSYIFLLRGVGLFKNVNKRRSEDLSLKCEPRTG
jgi:hypothetical protein